MRFVSNQCKQCPFRPTSLPGWLGDYATGEITDLTWKGQAPFFCHTTINYKSATWEKKAMKEGKLCTGNLVFAKRMMAPQAQNDAIRRARIAVLAYEDQVECMGPVEFIKHHHEANEAVRNRR